MYSVSGYSCSSRVVRDERQLRGGRERETDDVRRERLADTLSNNGPDCCYDCMLNIPLRSLFSVEQFPHDGATRSDKGERDPDEHQKSLRK